MICRLRGTVMLTPERTEDFTAEPQLADVMRQAFQKACDVLQLKTDSSDPLADLVVTKIIEQAKAGEIDPERLQTSRIVRYLRHWWLAHRGHPPVRGSFLQRDVLGEIVN
jgi:hypothetical protein